MKSAKMLTMTGLLMVSSGYASATAIDFRGLNFSRSAPVWMDATYLPGELMLSGQVATSSTRATEQLYVGAMNVSFDGSLQLQDAFCVDRFNYISEGNYNVSLTAANSLPNGDRAAWLLHDVLPQISVAQAGAQQQNLGAALQLAIWDLVHDNGDGFTLGRIQKSSDPIHPTDGIILNLAQSFVANSAGHAYFGALVINNLDTNAHTQRLIVDGPGDTVPEPSTWALALGALALGAFRRKSQA